MTISRFGQTNLEKVLVSCDVRDFIHFYLRDTKETELTICLRPRFPRPGDFPRRLRRASVVVFLLRIKFLTFFC